MGRSAGPAVPLLIEAMGDKESRVRSSAAEAVGDIGPRASSAVPALTDLLRDKENYVRGVAACSLGKMGRAAKSAVPALIAASRNPQLDVGKKAAEALRAIDPDAAPKAGSP